jgi:hypothetical protein
MFQLLLLFLLIVASGLLIMRRTAWRASFDIVTLLLAAALGLAVISIVTAFTLRSGIAAEQSILFMAAVVVIVLGADLSLRPATTSSATPAEFPSDPWWDRIASALIALVHILPVLLACAWMGAGPAPAVFFNVDTAYYVTHVQSLAHFGAFPPPSLNVQGFTQLYHYGAQLSAALFARFADVPAHTALFWIAIPVFLLGKVAAIWRLATLAARRGIPRWLCVLCLLFFIEYPLESIHEKIPYLLSEPVKQGRDILEKFLVVQRFGTGFPMASNVAGWFLIYLIGLLMVDSSIPRRWLGIAVAAGCLPFFKSPYIVPVGLWIGIWALYHLFRYRNLRPFLAASGAFLLALAASRLTVRSGFSFSIVLDPWSQHLKWRHEIWKALLEYGSLVGAGAFGMLLVRRPFPGKASGKAGDDLAFLLAAIVLLLLPALVIAKYVGSPDAEDLGLHTLQWYPPLRAVVAIAVVVAAAHGWPELAPARRLMFGALIVVWTAFPLFVKTRDAVAIVTAPESWHEFADNRRIIPALAVVPVQGSLIASNDLYYPADNYGRHDRQFQIAALFGHQAYAAGMFYDPPPDAAARSYEQQLLREPAWSEALTKIACTRGWTHVLLSKRVPYVQSVPGTLLYDSPDFSTYALPACPKDTPPG